MSTDTSESYIVKDGDKIIYDGTAYHAAMKAYRQRRDCYRPEFQHWVTVYEVRQIKDEELR